MCEAGAGTGTRIGMTNRSRSVVVALLLLVSATEFAVRGPLRLLHGMGWNDFLSPYIQSKAWVHGADPYSAQSLINFWPPDNQRPPFVDREAASGDPFTGCNGLQVLEIQRRPSICAWGFAREYGGER